MNDFNVFIFAILKGAGRVQIYDCIFIPGRDMYAYCASDHTIGICREHISLSGSKVTYSLYNKIFHGLLHVKLCYSAKAKTLCTLASTNVVYGWELEGSMPLFNISRHSDLVTDFIAIDELELFASCSMDKRIVIWSSITRRVKGVFIGHKRGIRSLSYSKNLMLSGKLLFPPF